MLVPTFQRPEMLARCLESLSTQTILENADHQVSIIVGDNNRDGSGCAQISEIKKHFPCNLSCIHVLAPGLCENRNALFAGALDQDADLVALVDDDEWAEPTWLAALVAGMEATQADAMIGLVQTIFHPATPEWFKHSGIGHTNPRNASLRTGAPSPKRATHNTIVRAEVLRAVAPPWFPLELNFLGSEDHAFFMRAKQLGFGKVLWCAEAVVTEEMSLGRSERTYFVKRALQNGASSVIAAKIVAGAAAAWKTTAKDTARLILGIPFIIPHRSRYRYLRHAIYVYGRFVGHFGRPKNFYGT